MKIWLVWRQYDCEDQRVLCACPTEAIAMREMFKARDAIIAPYHDIIKSGKADEYMIEWYNALSSNHTENWCDEFAYITVLDVVN